MVARPIKLLIYVLLILGALAWMVYFSSEWLTGFVALVTRVLPLSRDWLIHFGIVANALIPILILVFAALLLYLEYSDWKIEKELKEEEKRLEKEEKKAKKTKK